MAEDPKRLAEENKFLKERNKFLEEGYSLSTSYLESLKEVLGIQSKLSQYESDTLEVNKQLQKLIKNQNTDLNSIAEKTKEIAKNDNLIAKANLTIQGLNNSMSSKKKEQVDYAKKQVELQNSLTQKIQEELQKAETGEKINVRRLAGLKGRLAQQEKLVEKELESLNPLQKQLLFTELSNSELEKQNKLRKAELDTLKEIDKTLGATGKFTELLGKIPGLGKYASDALGEVEKKIKKAKEEGGEIPNRFQAMKMVLGEVGGSLKTFLTDPLTVGVALGGLLVKSFLDSNKRTTELQKNLSLSTEEAIQINKEYSMFALTSDSLAVNSKNMAASLGQVQELMGSIGKMSAQSAETFARMSKAAGVTEESAAGLVAQSAAFGKNSDQVYTSQLRTTHEVSQQYKTQVNQKAVLNEVGKASAYTLVQFRGSTQALTEAVAKSKALGLSLESLGKISSGLLDFQSSIENELSAELLTGKQINLEQARYYALTNQQSKLMDELNSQIGTFSDYSSMNVLQQEAYAKSLGMSSNELSEMLFKQEYRGKTEQDIANIADEDLRKRVEAMSMQDKFQAAMEKFQTTLSDIVAGPLGDFLTSTTGIYTVLGLIVGSSLVKMISGLGQIAKMAKAIKLQEIGTSIAKAWGAAFSGPASFATGGLAGLAVGAGLTAAIMGAVAFADDLYSPGGGYGKRMLLAPEGAFALNDNDNVIATTNPVPVNDMISRPKGAINVAPQQVSQRSEIKVAPSNTQIAINLDGAALGNASARSNYSVGSNIKSLGGKVDYSAPI
jgi:hypothetical protein